MCSGDFNDAVLFKQLENFYRVTGHSEHTFGKIIQTSLGHGCQHLQPRRVGLLDEKVLKTQFKKYLHLDTYIKNNGEKYFCIAVI